jgi:hypothetical protein
MLILALVAALVPMSAAADSVVNPSPPPLVLPQEVPGNPTCGDLLAGWKYEFKVDQALGPGSYSFKSGDPNVVETSDPPGSTSEFEVDIVVTSTALGDVLAFESNFPVQGVYVKGGATGNLYDYYSAGLFDVTADSNLHAPVNPQNNLYYGISHVSFCFDEPPIVLQGLLASKTADATYTRTVTWDINKSADPSTLNLFRGDSGETIWTVAVTKSEQESDFAVSGDITIRNPNAVPVDFTVSDVLDDGTVANVNCPTLEAPAAVGEVPGEVVCTYSAAPTGRTATLNTATVSVDGYPDVPATAPLTWVETLVGYDTIDVTDTNGESWQTSTSNSWTYPETFTCDDDEGSHDNTATITQTEQSDDATVTVNCYSLNVTKDALTSLTRTWTWDIEKEGDQTELTLAPGQTHEVNYTVTVGATSQDTLHSVTGDIIIQNPAPIAAVINSVTDVVSPDIAATVDCGSTVFPYTLAAGASLTACSYTAALPDDADRNNIATATLQNYSYDAAGVATAAGTTAFTGNADVSFANAIVTEIDECIDVSDDQYGPLGQVCATTASPFTHTFPVYSMFVGPYEECGSFTFVNVASFVTNDTGATGSDDHTVTITVPCPSCTLTPGYWKTHSKYGPAPYDDTWAEIGEDTPFFKSGQSYYEVLWTPPTSGNAYYILAHPYIAAELNVLNGAVMPAEVEAAFDRATEIFEAYTPDEIASMRGRNGTALRAEMVDLAMILDDWNNDFHCDEDGNSSA